MEERKNIYYKHTWEDSNIYISGCHLPDPDKGPYRFINCDIHPGLFEVLTSKYIGSEFINTHTGSNLK